MANVKKERQAPPDSEASAQAVFPVVGIGASAGGLEAVERFLSRMPADSGIALVLVMHLAPAQGEGTAELIRRFTGLRVEMIRDSATLRPDTLYLAPAGKNVAILSHALQVLEPEARRGPNLPIDFFFRSLAESRRGDAIGIILSGAGSDGALGLRAIKSAGGMILAQDEETARFGGMPRSAAATGLVDFILPPEDMPEHILRYIRHPVFERAAADTSAPPAAGSLEKVTLLVRDLTGHDFSQYKKSTILRRIERRMAVHRLERVEEYVGYLRSNPREVERLFREFLIGVTEFFRDPEAFEALRTAALPLIFENRTPADAIRVWVAGCSTGEEAYSIAILFREYLEERRLVNHFTIFATDIDPVAIETARTGLFPQRISARVTPERLARFFTLEDHGYRIKKEIRETIIFAPQNIIKDPPFIRLDLVSCRNLLIYLDAELQRKVLQLLHFSLNQGGILFLGSSETVGRFSELFTPVDRKWKIYRKRGIRIHERLEFPISYFSGHFAEIDRKGDRFMNREGIRLIVERILLHHFTPPGVLVDEKGDILFISGKTGKFLEPAAGEPTLNILEMAREGLKMFLSTALRQAVEKGEEVRLRDIRVRTNGGFSTVQVTVRPGGGTEALKGTLLVVFEEEAAPPAAAGEPAAPGAEERERIAQLERELGNAREYLQTTIEELETSNDELKSSNEELQSANEELQSSNEELETSREELQSMNEELVTLNTELSSKIEELSHANSDMNNLLAGTEIAAIFLDRDLKVKRFTPAAGEVINLIPADVGRPLSHIVSNLKYQGLAQDAEEVMETLRTKEQEVRGRDGQWYFMRVIPYRTVEGAVGGAVITLVNITDLKRLEDQRKTHLLAGNIVDALREPLIVLDTEMRVVTANRSFYRDFRVNPEEIEGRFLSELANGQWNIPALRELLDAVIRWDEAFENYRVERDFPETGHRSMLLNARKMPADTPEGAMVLLEVEDVTGRG